MFLIWVICQFGRKSFKCQKFNLGYSGVGRKPWGLDEINETTFKSSESVRAQMEITPVHLASVMKMNQMGFE